MINHWQNLRSWNNSQYTAFEELCCQLAAYEDVPRGSTFIRKAAPDAGIECFWKLPNGDEWGWQAKFFCYTPKKTQWSDIDDSVKTALKKHPQLTSYIICLPIDRQDPRDEKKWFMDNWNEHEGMWKEWAQEKGMSVKYVYWGNFEIWERLSQDKHVGRRYFWFNEREFNNDWAKKHLKIALADAGERYAPNLNVKLPIANLFAGLGRTDEFWSEFRVLHKKIEHEYSNINRADFRDILEIVTEEEISVLLHESNISRDKIFEETNYGYKFLKDFNKLQSLDCYNADLGNNFHYLCDIWLRVNLCKIIENIIDIIFKNINSRFEKIDLEYVSQICSQCSHVISGYIVQCFGDFEKVKKKRDGEIDNYQDWDNYYRNSLWELDRELRNLNDFVCSEKAALANKPAMLMVGDALIGKTHLFCDIASERIHQELPTVLILGNHLMSADNPWKQILNELGLSCTREEFVGALDAWAQAKNMRALLMIDAINEGNGKAIWYEHLAGFLEFLKDYPTIGIALSVRRSDLSSTMKRDIIEKYLIEVNHPGFQGVEYLALSIYCKAFGLFMPNFPIIYPAFLNPGFLYLLCKSLKNQGKNRIEVGAAGFSQIFENYVDSIHMKIWHPNNLNYPEEVNLVNKAVSLIVEIMVESGNMWVDYEKAQKIVNDLLPGRQHDKSLFQALISEGLLAKDIFLCGSEDKLGVRFPYQRFENHFVSKFWIDKYIDNSTSSKLGLLVKDETTCWQNSGLIEAFSVQFPERIGKELTEVFPSCAVYQPVGEAFTESLIWRNPKSFTDATLDYINKYILNYEDKRGRFLNVLLTVASIPEHPYNSDFLHKYLMKFELAERDVWWSIFLHYQYGEHDAVDRLIDWAWSTEDKMHIHDESIRLCGISLAWFLTTSNRYLRDRTTKAMVSLLTNRIQILRQILGEFINVNDPYVLERLFAVAYGCAMRCTNKKDISELAKDVYEWIFENGTPPPHFLLRDYARGVIEVALHHGVEIDIDVTKIKPPYKSEWPSEIPSTEDLAKYGEWQEGMLDKEWERTDLFYSVMGSGDFARYIIGTNFGNFEWTSHRLGEPRNPSREEIYEDFVQSLSGIQKKSWKRYNTVRNQERLRQISWLWDQSKMPDVFKREKHEDSIENCEESLLKTLSKKKLKTFKDIVIPYLNDPSLSKNESRFDLSIAQRWIFKRVLDLGWTVERFGKFDGNVNRYSNNIRGENKSERIGKKYQWIAYHEFLARVSDNFEFKGDYRSHRCEKYEGPWQKMYVRDIDPSYILRKTEREEWKANTNNWWFPSPYDNWISEHADIEWLKGTKDLPAIEPLIEVTDLQNSSKWLNLESFYKWEQPTPSEEESFETQRREIWYMLKSYIVKKSDMNELFNWAKKQNFIGGWMPESHEFTNVFLGEYYWAPAFEYYNILYYNDLGRTDGEGNRIPKDVIVSTDKYMQDNGYDCSIDGHIRIDLPAKWLIDGMHLRWNGVEGYLFAEKGDLVAFDPSIRASGPGALLINRESLIKFLDENDYDLLWTVVGEKNILGGISSRDKFKGRLEISGTYRISKNNVEGLINTKFVS